jgi:hypothetical protein
MITSNATDAPVLFEGARWRGTAVDVPAGCFGGVFGAVVVGVGAVAVGLSGNRWISSRGSRSCPDAASAGAVGALMTAVIAVSPTASARAAINVRAGRFT